MAASWSSVCGSSSVSRTVAIPRAESIVMAPATRLPDESNVTPTVSATGSDGVPSHVETTEGDRPSGPVPGYVSLW
jgi:hypothetical protein